MADIDTEDTVDTTEAVETPEVADTSEQTQEVAPESQTQEEATPVEQPSEGTPQGQGSDEEPEFTLDENGNLRWNIGDEKEEATEEPRNGQTEETEPAKETKTEQAPKYTVKVGGQEVEVDRDELVRGYLRQADYTRKTQELAEQRRQIQQYQQYAAQQRQYQQQTPQGGQEAQQESPDLTALAKQMAAKRLNLESPDDLSELNFDHITAVVEAKQFINNQRNAMMARQNAIQNLEHQLRADDPAYDDVMADAQSKMDTLPHAEYVKLQRAYNEGNPEPLRAFYRQVQKEHYANAVKRTDSAKKPVPKVEPAGKAPVAPQPQKRIDFRQLGSMTTEQKAKVLIDMGIV